MEKETINSPFSGLVFYLRLISTPKQELRNFKAPKRRLQYQTLTREPELRYLISNSSLFWSIFAGAELGKKQQFDA